MDCMSRSLAAAQARANHEFQIRFTRRPWVFQVPAEVVAAHPSHNQDQGSFDYFGLIAYAQGGKTQRAGQPTLQCTARPNNVSVAHE